MEAVEKHTSFKARCVRIIKNVFPLILCVAITLFVTKNIIGLAIVVGSSMNPTMNSGDILVVNRLHNSFERFDIVIVKLPDQTVVKRVVGLPGDIVQIQDGAVYINNAKVDDVVVCSTDDAGIASEPLLLGGDEYFVLGDNRGESLDSRDPSVGAIRKSQIEGRVLFSLLPPSSIRTSN